MKDDVLGSGISRRSTLKTIGAVGAFSLAGFTGTAAAKNRDKTYGNGNGIGAFLNEEAEYKETPIWTGGVADMRGMETATVHVGTMTSVDLPEGFPPFDDLPVAYAPLVVNVSPGATVRWEWVGNPLNFPIPHNVVSLDEDENGDPLFENPEGVVYQVGLTYEKEFEDRGNYLYYCTPHGAPFPVHPMGDETQPKVYNEFGMRAAVKVTGKPL